MNPAHPPPRTVSARELASLHAAVFLDAYGVLVDAQGALPGAADLLRDFTRAGVAHLVLTNDASRSAETHRRRFASLGMDVPVERIVSAGDLIEPWFRARGLSGARCLVVGTEDSREFVRRAGGEVIPFEPTLVPDVVALCDDPGADFLAAAETVLSALFHALDAGRTPALVLPNPDVMYPKRAGFYGFTTGGMALMLERALALRHPSVTGLTFDRLGKPHAPIFDEACRRAGTRDAVMVGDQVATDVAGAADFGLASALAGTGLSRFDEVLKGTLWPTYYLPSLT